MKANLPVTQNEVMFGDAALIVSKTDLKGQITAINKDFLDVSGYSEAELIGQPHNLVRHPDMPPAVFEDLWATLRDERPWVGCVKNRCKNGEFYWVEAHTAPIWEGAQVVGYMSVGRQLSREKVAAAERGYALLNQNQQGNLRIRDGVIHSPHLFAGVVEKLSGLRIATKIMLASGLGVLLIMGVLAFGLGQHLSQSLNARSLAELKQNLALIKGMVEVRALAMSKESSRLNRIFAANYPEPFVLEGTVLRSGKTVVNGRFNETDRFTVDTGAVATVFARDGDDFVRVTTSVKKENGERAVGTKLDRQHPGYARLKSGEAYIGKAKLFGKDFYTSYTPIKSEDGSVIGATFIGLDVSTEIDELKKQLKSIKVGQTGYFYVLDSKPGKDQGTLLVHPAKEGSNILAAKDADGREFIREIIEKKQGESYYPWLNAELGETQPRLKIVAFDTVQDWQWTIGGGTYVDEFQGLSRDMVRLLWSAAGIVVVVLIAMISWLVNALIRKPLAEQVLPTFRALSGGKYDSPLDVGRKDEIGSVLQGLESMQTRLGFEVSDAKRQADEMTRIKIALDNVGTGVIISDAGENVIYTNHAVVGTLKSAEEGIRQVMPGFNAEQMLGSKLDALLRLGQHEASPAAGAAQALEVGGRNLTVVTNQVRNAQGERLGTVAELTDRTLEVAIEREVQGIIFAAAQGDLSKRLTTDDKEGFFAGLALGLNQLLETTSGGISAVADVINALAEGNLTRRIEADYQGAFGELKDGTNTTVDRLRSLVGQIKEATEAINTAATEIAAGNNELSTRTEEQASSLEETASSMEELNATVRQTAENARQANDLSRNSNQIATRGGEIVRSVVTTMGHIESSSRKIVDIISVIDGIAFQTNILALNAAVEAARAGEQGRGFAVVATEVRNLAQRSAMAAKEIKGLIAESVAKVEEGSKLVEHAGNTMDEVVSSFHKVATLVTDITDASKEQADGITQVTLAVNQMDQGTQQNAALVEQAAAAAESLQEQAQGLMQSVQAFNLGQVAALPSSPQRSSPAPKRKPATLAPPAPPQAKKATAIAEAHIEDEWAEF